MVAVSTLNCSHQHSTLSWGPGTDSHSRLNLGPWTSGWNRQGTQHKLTKLFKFWASKVLRRHDNRSYLRLVGCPNPVHQPPPVSPIRKKKGNSGLWGLDKRQRACILPIATSVYTWVTALLKHVRNKAPQTINSILPPLDQVPIPTNLSPTHFCKLCPLFPSYTPESILPINSPADS